mgnify:CR=1 FL=1
MGASASGHMSLTIPRATQVRAIGCRAGMKQGLSHSDLPRFATGELLPAINRELYESRFDFNRPQGATSGLSCDQLAPTPAERLEANIAWIGMFSDRSGKEFHGFLGWMLIADDTL